MREQLAQAVQRISELEAKKTPPPRFVKANTPVAISKRERQRRASEHNRARRREAPSVVVRQALPTCPDGGRRLGGVHVGQRRQVVDLPPPARVVVVAEYALEKGWCAQCQRWQEARVNLAGQTLGQGRLGVGIAALVAHLRTSPRLPLRRLQAELGGAGRSWAELADLHGLPVSGGGTGGAHAAGGRARRGVGGADSATGTESPGRPRRRDGLARGEAERRGRTARPGEAWVLATPEGERDVAYQRRRRAGAGANDLLGEGFTGVLVSDFAAAYTDTPGGRQQRGWAHLLRDAHALGEAALGEAHADDLSPRGIETRAWVAALTRVWRRVHHTLTVSPPLTVAQRQIRHQRLLLDLQALGARFLRQRERPCRALAWRVWHFQRALLTCVGQSGVPPDNHLAERAIRPLVSTRKISSGTRSAQGSLAHPRLYALAATWTARGHNPLTQFRALLTTPLPQV